MARSRFPVPALLGAAIAMSATLSGCAQGVRQANADELTPRQLAVLERELGGKTAGQPTACLASTRTDNVIRVSDNILLYRVSGNLVYKNELNPGCPGLSDDSEIMVSEIRGPGPCRGDIIHMVDHTSGIRGASCALGDFVPYRRARAAE